MVCIQDIDELWRLLFWDPWSRWGTLNPVWEKFYAGGEPYLCVTSVLTILFVLKGNYFVLHVFEGIKTANW